MIRPQLNDILSPLGMVCAAPELHYLGGVPLMIEISCNSKVRDLMRVKHKRSLFWAGVPCSLWLGTPIIASLFVHVKLARSPLLDPVCCQGGSSFLVPCISESFRLWGTPASCPFSKRTASQLAQRCCYSWRLCLTYRGVLHGCMLAGCMYVDCVWWYASLDLARSEVEQPGSSVLRRFPLIKHVIRACLHSGKRCFFKRFFLGAYGHFSCKPTWLLGYFNKLIETLFSR